jgi:hypothetical protein
VSKQPHFKYAAVVVEPIGARVAPAADDRRRPTRRRRPPTAVVGSRT